MKKRIPAFVAALAMITSSAAAMPVPKVNAEFKLPSHVDLSETEYFPEIIYQQYNSCGACAAGYYQFTYEARKLLKEEDADANIDFSFSPSALYNQVNHGSDNGSNIWGIYDNLKVHGALTREQFPYEELIGIDFSQRPAAVMYLTEDELSNYTKNEQKLFEKTEDGYYRRRGEYITRQEYEALDIDEHYLYHPTPDCEYYLKREDLSAVLPNDESDLLNALTLRINDPHFIEMDPFTKYVDDEEVELDDEESAAVVKKGIKEIKQKLYEGKVLVTLSDGDNIDNFTLSATKNGKPFNEEVVYQDKVNMLSASHFLTIVGYDDDIAYDINGDGEIDPETEKGAFKVASSDGEGWGTNGFRWIMYDALYRNSQSGVMEVENPEVNNDDDYDDSYDDIDLSDRELSDGMSLPEWGDPYEETDLYEETDAPEDYEQPEYLDYMKEKRKAAFFGAFYIDAVKKDIKLVSEADVYTTNYYDVLIGNECNGESVLTDEVNKGSYENAIEYNGVFVTDITELCGENANNKTYRINVGNINSSEDTRVVVKSICLKDDKGNVVAEKRFFSDSQIEARLKRLAPGNYFTNTLKVELPSGDMNYDGVYDKKDYKIVKAYFNDPDSSDLSSFQKDLLDADNNGKIDKKDYKILKASYKK